MKLNTRSLRALLPIFVTLLILFEMAAYASTIVRSQEQFFQFYLLGANHSASDYYPDQDTNIRLGEPITWYVGATDNMGATEFVSIRVKVSNATIKAPNDLQALPSAAPAVAEFARFLQDNETLEIPFIWSLSNVSLYQGSVHILMLQINNETYQISDWSANNGYNFRLIFELWTWNVDTANYQIGWMSGDQHKIAWLHIWFNLVPGGGQ
jgi:hypothetical protein